MRDIFLCIPFVPPLEQNKCYNKDINAVTCNRRLESSRLLISHVSLAFPSASKKTPNPIRSDVVLVFLQGHVFPQSTKVMLVSGPESWLEKPVICPSPC